MGQASSHEVEQGKWKKTAGQPLTVASEKSAVVGLLACPGTPYHEVAREFQWHRAVWNYNIFTTYEMCRVCFCLEKPNTLFKPRLYSQSCLKKEKCFLA